MEAGQMRKSPAIARSLKLKDLQTLIAVAETGGITKAAHRLYTAQSVISKSIANLELAIEKPLLDRSRRGAVLTSYGEVLFECANSISECLRNGLIDLEALDDPTTGEIRIAASEPVAALIAVFSDKFPKTRYKLDTGHPAEICEKLRAEQIDFAITQVFPQLALDGLLVEKLQDDPVVVVCGASNVFARRKKITIRDLGEARWVLPPASSFISMEVKRAFEEAGAVAPQALVTTHSAFLRVLAAANGDFVTVIPKRLLTGAMQRFPIKTLSIPLQSGARPMCLIRRKQHVLSAPAKSFMAALRRAASADHSFTSR
jgi:DNA-binding transcriptional LysR family regulator